MLSSTRLAQSAAAVFAVAAAASVALVSAPAASARSQAQCTAPTIARAATVYEDSHGGRAQITDVSLDSYQCADGYAIAELGTTEGGGSGFAMTLKSNGNQWQAMQLSNLFNEQEPGGIPKGVFERVAHAPVHSLSPPRRL